jgi:asparagine synthase (glutamine-hydrolysing)
MVQREWTDYDAVKTTKQVYLLLKSGSSCSQQLMSDVPYRLLSGGLDSSVTSAIAKKYAQKRIESGDVADAWYPNYTLFQ